eukprot:scaffold17797_cov68-Phaeocystis_antarctica.AAC.4
MPGPRHRLIVAFANYICKGNERCGSPEINLSSPETDVPAASCNAVYNAFGLEVTHPAEC